MTTLLEEKATQEQAVFRKPAYDIMSTSEGVRLDILLPGIAKQDIELTLKNNILYLKATRSKPSPNNLRLIHREIPSVDFQLSLRLNNKLDTDSLTAECQNGILTICLKNSKEAKPKSIKVN